MWEMGTAERCRQNQTKSTTQTISLKYNDNDWNICWWSMLAIKVSICTTRCIFSLTHFGAISSQGISSDWSFLNTENTVYIIFHISNDVYSLFVINNDIYLQICHIQNYFEIWNWFSPFFDLFPTLYKKFTFCRFGTRWLAFSYLLLLPSTG